MNITIRGNEINEPVLREIRTLLIPPTKRTVMVAVLAVYLVMAVIVVSQQLWYWLLIFTPIVLFFIIVQPYIRQNKVINQMIKIMRGTYGRPVCTFDVTFEEACVRSINVKTRETVRLPYEDFLKMTQTENVIAMVTRKGHLVVVDRAKAGEETCAQVLEIIRTRCPNLKFR